MNNEMMLFQARQDFIDMHKDLLTGKSISLEKYDSISADLKSMDDINFELILQFVGEVDHFDIRRMWTEISTYIEKIKSSGNWQERKEDIIAWRNEQLCVEHREGKD